MLQFSSVDYKNYGKCVKIENDLAVVLVSLDIGPRIVHYSLKDGENVFFCDVERKQNIVTDEYKKAYGENSEWQLYAGHRIWSAPELFEITYTPDNVPVSFVRDGNAAIFTSTAAPHAGFKKSLRVELDENSAELTVTHIIQNVDSKPQSFAVWGISAMAPGGTEIIAFTKPNTDYLPDRNISFWSYADICDYRTFWGHKYATLRQDPNATERFKCGMLSTVGKAYYVNQNTVFSLSFPCDENSVYLDRMCNYETYTNNLFLEMESLGPIKEVASGASLEHVEKWNLQAISNAPDLSSDDAIDAFISSLSI